MGEQKTRATQASTDSSSAPVHFGSEWATAPQLMHLFRAQEKILQASVGFTQRYMDRQNKATATSIAAARIMQETPCDIHALQTMFSQLPMQYFEKTTEDFADWVAFCRECANHLTTEEIAAEADIIGLTEEAAAKRKLPTRIPV